MILHVTTTDMEEICKENGTNNQKKAENISKKNAKF